MSGYRGKANARIIAICKAEQQRLLKQMDKAVAAAQKGAQMADGQKLLPGPFCGGAASLSEQSTHARCFGCNVLPWITAQDWNRRATQLATGNAPSDELLEAVGKLVKAKGHFHAEQNYKALVAAYDSALANKKGT